MLFKPNTNRDGDELDEILSQYISLANEEMEEDKDFERSSSNRKKKSVKRHIIYNHDARGQNVPVTPDNSPWYSQYVVSPAT
jgi:hypothetical protein